MGRAAVFSATTADIAAGAAEVHSGATVRDAAAARCEDADVSLGSATRAATDAALSGFLAGGSGDCRTGEFAVLEQWHSSERWGAEVALSVHAGDYVYISEVDVQGWARGTLHDGQSGWLPFSACKRRIFPATVPVNGGAAGYCDIGLDDHLVVYHREDNDWIYGARLPRAGVDGARGWFPACAVATASP